MFAWAAFSFPTRVIGIRKTLIGAFAHGGQFTVANSTAGPRVAICGAL
jgi:hypothetical protein